MHLKYRYNFSMNPEALAQQLNRDPFVPLALAPRRFAGPIRNNCCIVRFMWLVFHQKLIRPRVYYLAFEPGGVHGKNLRPVDGCVHDVLILTNFPANAFNRLAKTRSRCARAAAYLPLTKVKLGRPQNKLEF